MTDDEIRRRLPDADPKKLQLVALDAWWKKENGEWVRLGEPLDSDLRLTRHTAAPPGTGVEPPPVRAGGGPVSPIER